MFHTFDLVVMQNVPNGDLTDKVVRASDLRRRETRYMGRN
jgi:hypothetical protein